MKPKITVYSISTNRDSVIIRFSADEVLQKYFKSEEFIYTCSQCELVPSSIAVIPFVCNVLPIVWLTDSALCVEELDKTFYESIQEFKRGYIEMYPQLDFKGELEIKQLVSNEYEVNKSLVMFSGGIDAICTTLRHIDENPLLLTLWGSADFPTDDEKGWKIQWNNIQYTANKFGLDCHYIKTNFYEFLNKRELTKLISPVKGGWWHEMQHGIGILGHAAPFAYIYKIKTVYIASSFDISKKPYNCASDPTIDNYVKFGSTLVVHDGYELNRQDKVGYVVQQLKKLDIQLTIHVCLRQYQLGNCCACEKCYRTILALLAEGVDPNEYGFSYDSSQLPCIFDYYNHIYFLDRGKIITYQQIQRRVAENSGNISDKVLVKWFAETNFNKINNDFQKQFHIYYKRIRRKLGNILRTLKLKK